MILGNTGWQVFEKRGRCRKARSRSGRHGKQDREGTALSRAAFDFYPATVGLDDGFSDTKPQAGALPPL